MEKLMVGIMATITALSIGFTSAFVRGSRNEQNCVSVNNDVYNNCAAYNGKCMTGNEYGKYFVDTNGDGICDNCGGYYANDITGTTQGGNYVDIDGDGVCDNYASSHNNHANRHGNRRGHGHCGW